VGIQPGDFITHVNGREMRTSNALTLAVGDIKPGDKASLTIFREGTTRNVDVRIEARDEEVTTDQKKLWPGLYVVPLTDAVRSSLKLDANTQGLYVANVVARSPASIMGLQRGDLITGINGEKVRDLASFYRTLREKGSAELWFELVRGDASLETMKYKR
jgi:S1-C subfamily serine protease